MASVVVVIGVVTLVLMSVAANQKFHDRDRLPMQWSLDRRVNWSAPRPIALAFTPALAVVVLIVLLQLLASDPEVQFWTLVAVAAVFVGVHWLHLYLLERWPET